LTDTSLTKFAWPCLEYILIDTQLISNHDHEPAFAARFIGLARGRSLPRWSQAPRLISCSLVGQKAATDSKANELRLLEHDFFASL